MVTAVAMAVTDESLRTFAMAALVYPPSLLITPLFSLHIWPTVDQYGHQAVHSSLMCFMDEWTMSTGPHVEDVSAKVTAIARVE
ncbi:hypothetical protein FCV25MIE_07342 [Fagus crenata]